MHRRFQPRIKKSDHLTDKHISATVYRTAVANSFKVSRGGSIKFEANLVHAMDFASFVRSL